MNRSECSLGSDDASGTIFCALQAPAGLLLLLLSNLSSVARAALRPPPRYRDAVARPACLARLTMSSAWASPLLREKISACRLIAA
jgi:hypothetical protein